MDPERATSNHHHRDDLDCTDSATAKPSYPAAATSSCDHKQPTIPAPLASTFCCTCSQANLLRIDNFPKGLHVDIHRNIFSTTNASSSDGNDTDWYQQLLTNVRWHRVKYKSNRFQKDCETPCWTAFYGGRQEYLPYTPVPSWFQPLIDQVTSHLGNGVIFNAFLLRLYFDGKDEIAWHTDGRAFLGDEPSIASLSLGCKATFQLRRMNNVWPCADGSKSTEGCVDVDTPVESFVLCDGDLLVMRGKTQKHWHHRVPKEKGRGVRLNINFRYVLPGLESERGQRTYYKYMVYGDCPMDSLPPSWTFDEIMAKRGGMMNFVQRGIKRKNMKCDVGETDEQSTKENREERNLKELICKTSDTASSSTGGFHSSNPECCKNYNSEHDAQQYLTSEQSVDAEVFMALPVEIRDELMSQWKSQQTNQSTIFSPSPLPQINNANAKRKQSGKNISPSFRKGTIDSFFVKKL